MATQRPVSSWRVRVVVLGGCLSLLPMMAVGFGSEWLLLHFVVVHLMYCLCSLMGGYWSSNFTTANNSANVSNCSLIDKEKLFPKSSIPVHSASELLTSIGPNTESIANAYVSKTPDMRLAKKSNGASSKSSKNGNSMLGHGSTGTGTASKSNATSNSTAGCGLSGGDVKCVVTSSRRSESSSLSGSSQTLAGRRSSFGWIRVQVLSQVMALLFMVAFCFSLVVQAIQRLAAPNDVPLPGPQLAPLAVCVLTLLVHLGAVVLTGGFSRLQAVLLWPDTASHTGSHWLFRCCCSVGRDMFAALMTLPLLLCAHYSERLTGVGDWPQRYADPVLVLVAVFLLLWWSTSVATTSSRLLLQAQPVASQLSAGRLVEKLLAGRHVIGVHELHVWQLTPALTVLTAHVLLHHHLLQLPEGEAAVNQLLGELTIKLQQLGVAQIALQPEFGANSSSSCFASSDAGISVVSDAKSQKCLLDCSIERCKEARCCLPVKISADDSLFQASDADVESRVGAGIDSIQPTSPDCRCSDESEFVTVDLSSRRASSATTAEAKMSVAGNTCHPNSGTPSKIATSYINRAFEQTL